VGWGHWLVGGHWWVGGSLVGGWSLVGGSLVGDVTLNEATPAPCTQSCTNSFCSCDPVALSPSNFRYFATNLNKLLVLIGSLFVVDSGGRLMYPGGRLMYPALLAGTFSEPGGKTYVKSRDRNISAKMGGSARARTGWEWERNEKKCFWSNSWTRTPHPQLSPTHHTHLWQCPVEVARVGGC
jgi:hypothetical protein